LSRGRSVSSGGGGSNRCKCEKCPWDSRGIAEGPDFVGVQRNWIVQLVSVTRRCCAGHRAPRQRNDEKPAHPDPPRSPPAIRHHRRAARTAKHCLNATMAFYAFSTNSDMLKTGLAVLSMHRVRHWALRLRALQFTCSNKRRSRSISAVPLPLSAGHPSGACAGSCIRAFT